MGALESLDQFSKQSNLPFLVIGGHAVICHGYSRRTLDLDILIAKGDAEAWKQYFLGQGYTLFSEAANFMQMKSDQERAWPLDFMLVSKETFTAMLADCIPAIVQNVSVKIPSIRHLIALKLHVLKQGLQHRVSKDMDDVINLVQINKVDVFSSDFKALCERYGNSEIYEFLKRSQR